MPIPNIAAAELVAPLGTQAIASTLWRILDMPRATRADFAQPRVAQRQQPPPDEDTSTRLNPDDRFIPPRTRRASGVALHLPIESAPRPADV